MRRILFLAPHSFPIHSSESICNAKVAYILAQLGYYVDVISIDDGASYPNADNVNLIFLKNDRLKVHPVVDKRPKNRFFSHLKSICVHLAVIIKTGYYYKGVNYSYLALKCSRKLFQKYGVDSYVAIISRGYRTEVASLVIKKKYGIRWIANWNDPYPVERFPYPYGHGPEAKLTTSMDNILRDIQKYADIHTFPNPRLRDYMLGYMKGVTAAHTEVIPHAAHSILTDHYTSLSSDALVLVHAGNVTHPRNPNYFLQALSSFVKTMPDAKIKCLFIGKVPEDFDLKINQLGIGEIVRYVAPQDYFTTLEYIKQSHVSVIIEAICEEGIYLPTKVVDSLQCGKPILCVSPKIGVLNDIIQDNNIGYWSDNESIESIKSAICSMYKDYSNGNLPIINKNDVWSFFEESIGKQYEQILG